MVAWLVTGREGHASRQRPARLPIAGKRNAAGIDCEGNEAGHWNELFSYIDWPLSDQGLSVHHHGNA